jgi:hypothetical protein
MIKKLEAVPGLFCNEDWTHTDFTNKINELIEQVNKLTTHLKGHLDTHQYPKKEQ